MASNKIYTVVKDGEELEKMKNLTAAKKLADSEGAEVYCDGKCVYHGTVEAPEDTAQDTKQVNVEDTVSVAPADTHEEAEGSVESPAKDSASDEQEVKTSESGDVAAYRIKTLMNVRSKPSMEGGKVGLKYGGDVVKAVLKDDWLHLSDGGFVLFGGGEFAEKV